jgi:parallel beta-helix repeat protein
LDRAAKRQAETGKAVTIQLRGGRYSLDAPLVLRPEHSGLILAAYRNEKPVLSGGRRITGWKIINLDGRKLWVVDLPELREGKWRFRELWVNGRRATRARRPNWGYFEVAELPDNTANWTDGQWRFRFKEGDLKTWATVTNAEVMVMTRWVESRLPITALDETERLVTFGKRSVFQLAAGDRYYIEGALELLDLAGEWYLDAAAGRLYYAPLPEETLDRAEVIAPVLPFVLRVEGQPEAGQFVERLKFRGLTFSHAEWDFPRDPEAAKRSAMVWPAPSTEIGGFAQAAIGVTGAVWGEGVRNCVFDRCKFLNLGAYGLELGRGCQSNIVSRCEFADLGAGGIKIGETRIRERAAEMAGDNEVSDCYLHEGGRTFHSAIGIWIGQSHNNRILHNEIHDFYYTGISIGWTWGYDPRALATNNLVAFNHVHHIGVMSDGDGPILSDMGGIYTLSMQPGTRIRNNLWRHIAGLRYGGWGIYTDEGSSGILIENNVVYRTTHGGFHQHYGATNIVRNNVFNFARDHQVQRSREEEHVSFSFSNNIVLFDQGVLLGSNWKNEKFIMDRNVYWDARLTNNPGNMKFAGTTLEQWRARGHDRNSVISDPLFVSPAGDDFRLKPNSPAFKIGFQPIDLRHVGPRK